jgi:hypothetical protein
MPDGYVARCASLTRPQRNIDHKEPRCERASKCLRRRHLGCRLLHIDVLHRNSRAPCKILSSPCGWAAQIPVGLSGQSGKFLIRTEPLARMLRHGH